MATIIEPFVLRSDEEPRMFIQRAMDVIASKAQENNFIVDWTTMQVVQTEVDSGIPVLGLITIVGVRVEGSPA